MRHRRPGARGPAPCTCRAPAPGVPAGAAGARCAACAITRCRTTCWTLWPGQLHTLARVLATSRAGAGVHAL